MQMVEARQLDYAAATKLAVKPEDSGRIIDAVRYLDRTASVTGTDISNWDLKEVFGSETGIVLDRAELNKRFFEYKLKVVSESPKVSQELDPKLVDLLKIYNDRLAKHRTSGIEQEIRYYWEDVKIKQRDMQNLLKTIREQSEKLELLKAGKHDVPSQIQEICKQGFWEVWDISQTESWIDLATKNEVMLNHVNPKANVNVHVNLGRFRFRIYFNTMDMYCYPLNNNRREIARIHPHVYADGRICWGTAGDVIGRAMTTGDIVKIVDIYTHILTNYNPDSPINSLHNYLNSTIFNPTMPVSPLQAKLNPPPKAKFVKVDELKRCDDCGDKVEECQCEDDEIDEDEDESDDSEEMPF